MEYRQLGKSGIKVSTLTLGTMMFGGPTDEASAARIIDQALEQGVNSIDTADVYAKGESERVVGRAIAAQRERWVLATKFANPLQDGDVNARGASRKHIVRAVDASLKRLNTDYIDLLYIHREDHETPVDETVRALNDLIRAGKLRSSQTGVEGCRVHKRLEDGPRLPRSPRARLSTVTDQSAGDPLRL